MKCNRMQRGRNCILSTLFSHFYVIMLIRIFISQHIVNVWDVSQCAIIISLKTDEMVTVVIEAEELLWEYSFHTVLFYVCHGSLHSLAMMVPFYLLVFLQRSPRFSLCLTQTKVDDHLHKYSEVNVFTVRNEHKVFPTCNRPNWCQAYRKTVWKEWLVNICWVKSVCSAFGSDFETGKGDKSNLRAFYCRTDHAWMHIMHFFTEEIIHVLVMLDAASHNR